MKKWKTLTSKRILNTPFFKVNSDQVLLPNNDQKTWIYWDSPDSVMVVGMTSDEKLVMIKQYRYLVDKVVIEFPSGSLHEGELVESGAQREFEEETGYKCGNLIFLGAYYETYGQLNRKIHIFFSKVTERIDQKLDAGNTGYEDIDVELINYEEVINMALDNKIDAMGSTLAALLLKQKLR